jgi:hypothetical protein
VRVRTGPACDLSAIVAVGDDEDRVGHAIRKIVVHLRALAGRFEVVAVDEQSADNSLSLLALLRREIPELHVVADASAGEGFARGVAVARGCTLLLIDPRRDPHLGTLPWALGRLEAGRDAVLLAGHYVVARRLLTWAALSQVRGRGANFERAFARKARSAGLHLERPRFGRERLWRELPRRLASRVLPV